MNRWSGRRPWTYVAALGTLLVLVAPRPARAHCDTLDGPVVAAARQALDAADPSPVLRWVKKGDEPEIRAAFDQALAARKQGPEAREVADRWFFETLVRVHRAGEGASYTGLKPAGTEPDPAVGMADRALEGGSVDALVAELSAQVASGIRQRFAAAMGTRKSADQSIEAGREYVEAYVEFIHYVERLHVDATTPAGHAETEDVGSRSAHGHE